MSNAHRDYFNNLAPEWCAKMTDAQEFRDHLIRFGVSFGDRVLDIGAGTGRMSKHLANLVGSDGMVVAEDIADRMLSEGRRVTENRRMHWLCDDVLALAIRNAVFDKVVCFSAFPHFQDPIKALQEMHRVLRPEGKLLILHTCSSYELNAFHASLEGIVCQDVLPKAEEMVPLLKKVGFREKKISETNGLYWVEAVKVE